MSPTERARYASNLRWATPGARAKQSAAAKSGQRRRAEQEVDPDGLMSPAELDAAVSNYFRARMARVRAGKNRGV